MAVIPNVVTNELIESAWGNAVANELNNRTHKIDGSPDIPGTILRATATADVSASSTAHGLQIGPRTGENLAMDGGEIMARNNGALTTLDLNADGGDVRAGAGTAGAGNARLACGQINNVAGAIPGAWMRADGPINSCISSTAGSVVSTGSVSLARVGTGPADVGGLFIRFSRTTADTEIGSVRIASGTSVNYNTTSDPRLKDNLGPITDAAERVRQLGRLAFRGRWIEDGPDGEVWDMLSSVDIEAVAPYAVFGEADGVDDRGAIVPQQVDYSALVPVILAALAAALDRIDALEGGGA